MKKVTRVIKAFDFAQVDLGFKIKKKDDYSTSLGGIVFLLYILVTSYLIITYFISFIDRTSFNQNAIENTLNDAPQLDIFNEKMAFAFGLLLDSEENIALNKYLDITVKYVTISKVNNSKIKISLPLTNCTKADFPSIIDEEFDFLQLNKFNCINKAKINHTQMYLQGIFTSEEYSYLEYSVFSLPYAKINSNDFITMFYNNDIKLQLYHLESSIRILNFETPESLFVTTKYITLSYPFVLKYNVDIINNTFVNDANILLPSETVFNYYTLVQLDTMSIFLGNTRLEDEFADSNLFGRIYLRSSQKTYQMKRVYQKFTEFLADATSIASQLLIILMFIIGLYDKFRAEECIIDNVLRYKEKIIKKIPNEFQKMKYLFDPQTMIQKNINQEKITIQGQTRRSVFSKTVDNSSHQQTQTQSQSQSQSQQVSSQYLTIHPSLFKSNALHSNEKTFNEDNDYCKPKKKTSFLIKPSVSRDIHRHRPSSIGPFLSTEIKKIGLRKIKTGIELNKTTMKHSLCDLIKVCFLKMGINSSIKAKSMMFDKGMEYFLYNLDIFTYFTKMREIDLIKYFLFNMNEICLIDFLAKPSISNVIPDNTAPISCVKNDFNITADNIQKVSEAFGALCQLYHNQQGDEKLIKFLKQTSYEIYQLIH